MMLRKQPHGVWLGALGVLAASMVLFTCRSSVPQPAVRPEAAQAESVPAEPGVQDEQALPCAPGARCLKVDDSGNIDPDGTSIAQCSGTFPDYIVPATQFPADYQGPWFRLAQSFPKTRPRKPKLPWAKIDYSKGVAEANAYLYALRDYSFAGMIAADFKPEKNRVRGWFHVPLMNFGPGQRELIHGVTRERTLRAPELGIKPGVSVANYAVGFYNSLGAYAIGKAWTAANPPDLTASKFPEGSMVFKILFSAAKPEDFVVPADYILEGAPEWQVATGNGRLTTIRLLQMDVAVRDDRAAATGWVFGTFAYDRNAPDTDPWKRLRPVGLMWGNDPEYTPADQAAGKPLKESIVSDQITPYAKSHLGWAGRVNGPVDNPASSCMSCHSTAQIAVNAPMIPPRSCDTDAKKLLWFRNVAGNQAFGAVNADNCTLVTRVPAAVPLDYSLQMQVAAQSVLQFRDKNPCAAEESPGPGVAAEAVTETIRSGAERVTREGTDGQ